MNKYTFLSSLQSVIGNPKCLSCGIQKSDLIPLYIEIALKRKCIFDILFF